VTGFFSNRLDFSAAALTYFSTLSLVPFLAFAFAVLKGFGAYGAFVEGVVRPWLAETFAGNPALHGAMERVLGFVEKTDVSRLGALGIVLLVYTSVTLVSNVEGELNKVFGATRGRSRLRQLTDYTTLLVTTPILLLAATAVSATAQSSAAVVWLRETLGLGPLIEFALGLAPLAVMFVAFFSLYVILPNVRTRLSSALLGAAVAAVLWQLVLVLHVRLQVGVARYSALYSAVGAIPIFLVWTWLSWLILLAGAQLAASHQNERAAQQRFRARRADAAMKEMVAVAAAALVARAFLRGEPRPDPADLARRMEVPLPVVEEVVAALVARGVLARAAPGDALLPAQDPGTVRLQALRDALRRDPDEAPLRGALARAGGPRLEPLLRAVDAGALPAGEDPTLRALAEAAGDGPT
jgi:membrane protein